MATVSTLQLRAGSGSIPRLPRHLNRGLEIVYLERGTLEWEVEGRIETVRAGSVFYTLPWEQHGSTHEYEPGHRWHYVIFTGATGRGPGDFRLPPQLHFSKQEARLVRAALLRNRRRCWPGNADLASLIPRIVRECSDGHPLASGARIALGTLILGELSRIISATGTPQPPLEARTALIRKFLLALESSCERPWTLAAMAGTCGIKRSHFTRLVREISGDSPLEYVRRLRIERARRLLRVTSRPVTDIALDCGFGSSQHFARIFRQFTGLGAREYRRGKNKPSGTPGRSTAKRKK